MARIRPKSPRRKANQSRSQATVDAVLEAAAQVLVREGYARAGTSRIAERAGVSVGSIYQYFDGKDAVFEELIRRHTERLVGVITRYESDPTISLEDELREILLLALRVSPMGPELFRHLEQVPNAALRRAVAEARLQVIRFVRDLLHAHRERLRVDDLELAAFLVVSAAEGSGMNADPERFDERLVGELTLMLSRYLTGAARRNDSRP